MSIWPPNASMQSWSLDSWWVQLWGKLFKSKLTSVSIERSEGDPLFCWAGTVGDLHLQLIPGRLLQVVQDVALGQRCTLGCGPGGRVHRSVLQYEGGDWTAAVVPADQVEPGPGGVDAGEEFMFFGKLGLWGGGGGDEKKNEAGNSGKCSSLQYLSLELPLKFTNLIIFNINFLVHLSHGSWLQLSHWCAPAPLHSGQSEWICTTCHTWGSPGGMNVHWGWWGNCPTAHCCPLSTVGCNLGGGGRGMREKNTWKGTDWKKSL